MVHPMFTGSYIISQSHSSYLILLSILIVVCITIIYFTLKLRKQLNETRRESDKFFEKLLQSADDGISFYDSFQNLKYANPAFYSLIGLDPESYHSIDPERLIHPDDLNYIDRKIRSLNDTGFFKGELRLRHNNGNYLHLSTKSVIVRKDNGEVLGSLTVSRDISHLKKTNEELVKANKEAGQSNRLKSSFLANVSHEIRTPLNSVVGFSNLLLAEDLTRELKKEYISQINYNSEKLLQIIGDIIDLSRLERSEMEIRYEETSLNNIIDEVVTETREIIRRNEKPIILNVKNSFITRCDLIFTDRIWLKRVLYHLMDNAVKFTLDGTIDFSIETDSEKILFRIKDTGIGINKENLARIFEEFHQEINGHQRPFEGLGVGLTLSREVIQKIGGNIFVNSEKGLGSEFGFSIPYRPAGSRKMFRADENSATPPDWKSYKCLIIDNNRDMILYLTRTLQETGIKIISARAGVEALQMVKFTPDINVVLIDMQMPELNGMEITREIRKLRPELPVIAQTAFLFENDKDIIIEAGCTAFLIKPFKREQLVSAIGRFLDPGKS